MRTLSTEQLHQLQDGGEPFTLINTLPADKFEETKIPGARNIPLDAPDFSQRVERAAGGKQNKVVLYCASAACDSSTKAAQRLEAAGFTNVYDYEGGAASWQQAELAE